MSAAALLADLRARGVEVITDGRRIGVRPAGALTVEEREALRQQKTAVLALLTPPLPALPRLDPEIVRDVLGDHPDPHAVACIAWDVANALRALEQEIRSGAIAPGPRLVHGRPLGDWLDLDDVARLLRTWRDREKHG